MAITTIQTTAPRGPNGYLICPGCAKENFDISKQSPPEYAYHRKCRPEIRQAMKARLTLLKQKVKRDRGLLALLVVCFLLTGCESLGQHYVWDPYASDIPVPAGVGWNR